MVEVDVVLRGRQASKDLAWTVGMRLSARLEVTPEGAAFHARSFTRLTPGSG